ncbi:hypothetical protein [Pseudonocardia zijingensis]|uniref:Uncharacterized protein n=1 Tax=Pseudonocardia zijingensis TaxID=153376 RepID=A0ABP3YL92_9PSEU
MTAAHGPQLDIAEVHAELESDPLSKALFERAQLRVIARQQAEQLRQQAEQIQLLTVRIDELERQKAPGTVGAPQSPGEL